MEEVTVYGITDELRRFDGMEKVPSIINGSITEDYTVIYDTNTKLFVFRENKLSVKPKYYSSSPEMLLYNDTAAKPVTIRKDTLFTDGKSVYAFDGSTGGLGKLYDISETLVNIVSTTVYGNVYRESEYLAAKRTGDDAKVYETARATKYNNDLLDTFFGEAAETADLRLKEFVGEPERTAPILSYMRVFKYPARYSESLWNFAKTSLKSFFKNYILAKWLETCNMEEAERYKDLAASDLEDVFEKMSYREEPDKAADPKGRTSKVKGNLEDTAAGKQQNNKYIKG